MKKLLSFLFIVSAIFYGQFMIANTEVISEGVWRSVPI